MAWQFSAVLASGVRFVGKGVLLLSQHSRVFRWTLTSCEPSKGTLASLRGATVIVRSKLYYTIDALREVKDCMPAVPCARGDG